VPTREKASAMPRLSYNCRMNSAFNAMRRVLPQPVKQAVGVVLRPFRRDFEREGRHEFFRRAFKALSFNRIDGDYAEFGCWGGMTFSLAYHEARRSGHRRRLWAFDSFEGLPSAATERDEHPVWQVGTLKTGLEEFRAICRKHGIPDAAYETVPGFYNVSLPRLSREGTGPRAISLAYIDCDLHSSTLDVLRYLAPLLKHGMILAFDDYYCFSSSQTSGERAAASEFFAGQREWRLVPYVQFGWHGMSFIVESVRILPEASPF
jgi:O-methyltransferase